MAGLEKEVAEGGESNNNNDRVEEYVELTRDLMASGFRRKRVIRQARKRSAGFASLSFPSPPPPVPLDLLPPPPAPDLPTHEKMRHSNLTFLFQKQLQNSDVNPLRRMIIPKKAAETFLPVLESKDGTLIRMRDFDGVRTWSFKYRYWPNNNSRMYVLENTGEFVNLHSLKQGDYILLYRDENQFYVIEAKRAADLEASADMTGNAVNELSLSDFEVIASSDMYVKFPLADDSNNSYIYETSFTTDTPFGFFDHSASNSHSNLKIDPLESFGSVESWLFDDLQFQ
uniref:TF-B3 domain-containing protein n=1 Tax=Kalanchoe fedtschenkoi TaxID=63787 RepID=A0A7N0T4P9_KALFE